MMYTLDEELNKKGSEARARILSAFDNALAAVEQLAYGTKVIGPVMATAQGLACPKCGTAVEETVYRIPPYWPALRWMLDWGRQIIKEEPTKRVAHEYPPEALEAMRRYVGEPNSTPIMLPEPNENGVIDLRNSNDADDANNS